MTDFLTNLKFKIFEIIYELKKNNLISNSFDESNISIDYSSRSKQGDVSTNVLILLKKNIENKTFNVENFLYDKINNLHFIKKIEIAKAGFLNIFFNSEYIIKNLHEVLLNSEKYGNSNIGQNKKVNVEFVSANPTGPIHIAHIRGAVLGDVISSILEATGYKVTREYYVNDAGSQIKILGDSLFKRYQEINGIKSQISDNEYPGLYLIDIAKEIFQQDKDKWIKENIDKRRKFFQKFAIKKLIDTIKEDLNSINIVFDNYVYETNIINSSIIDKFYEILNNKKLLYEGYLEKPKGDDNVNWKSRKQLLFRSSNFFDEIDRPIKKENGEWTYFASDAAYHYDKFLRKFDLIINIWGADHIGYINRMKSIMKAISDNSNLLDIRVCQIVRLVKDNKILKMSKREGNFVTLKKILNEVGKDSLRYFMISTKNETPMDFNINKVIEKNKDNQVFYCQYAYARASSVINKSKKYDQFKDFKNHYDQFDYFSLTPQEKEIILKILSWPYLLSQSSNFKQPHRITIFLEDLCSSFHSFWNMGKENESLRMIDISNNNKTITKLLWIECMRIVLKRAFEIIGIEAHENM